MNSYKIKNPYLLLIVVAHFLFGCQQEKQTLINPPFPEFDVSFTDYTIDATSGGTIEHPNGTTISFPPDALVDANGNLISGEVAIQYREFHDAVEVFFSGIPMDYKQEGEPTKIFQTAGMFDLRANQNNKEVFMANGKKVDISMASYVKGNEYQFYSLNEENGSWEFTGKPEVKPNQQKELLLTSLEEKKPEKFPYDADSHFIFDFNALLDIQYGSVYSAKKLGKEKTALRTFQSYGISSLNLRLYSNLTFKGKSYPASFMVWKTTANSQKIPKWIKNLQYYSDKVVKTGDATYGILLTEYKTNRKFYTELEAVMPLTHLLRLPAKDWQNKYEEELAQILIEEQRAEQMADVFRSFSVGNFGIHNYDYFMKDDNRVDLFASFDFQLPEENTIENNAIEAIYMVCGDNRTVVKYNRTMWENLPLTSNKGARLFTVLPGKEIAIYSKEDYASIDFESLKKEKEPSFHFKFSKSGDIIQHPNDLKERLGIKTRRLAM